MTYLEEVCGNTQKLYKKLSLPLLHNNDFNSFFDGGVLLGREQYGSSKLLFWERQLENKIKYSNTYLILNRIFKLNKNIVVI